MGTPSYASLADIRAAVKASEDSSDDPELLKHARWATARIDEHTRETFVPRLETRYPMLEARRGLARYLMLPNCAVELVEVKDTAGNVLTVDTHYRTFPRGQTPFRAIDAAYGWRWKSLYGNCDTSGFGHEAAEVRAYWCYRTRYGEAWLSAGTLTGDINASVSTIAVSDAENLSPGNLIRVGSEFMVVDEVDIGTGDIVVTRGVRGTTAAAHLNTDAIEVFQVEPVINRAAVRYAGLLVARIGSYETTTFDGVTTVQYPQDMPAEVANILAELEYPPVPGDGALMFS